MRDLGDFNSGEERVWNSEKVFEVIEKAGAGDVEAQYELGCFYTTGQGHLKPDMAQAFDWLSKAAAQGHAEAKEKLIEPEKVLEVIGKAEAGDAESQYQLGCFYTTGKISLQMSTLKAAEWFNKAAAQGHNAAKQMLKPS